MSGLATTMYKMLLDKKEKGGEMKGCRWKKRVDIVKRMLDHNY